MCDSDFACLWIESDGESGSGVDKMLYNRLFKPFLDCLGLMFLIRLLYLTNKYMNDKEFYFLFQKRGKNARLAVNEFVAMIPEAFHRKIYKKKGFGSIYELAAKVGGISKNVVDEVLRIDEKLKNMPKLKSKIAVVGLSKVKTVANTATAETDNEWAEKVTKLTRAALETQVRDIRNSIPGEGLPNTTQEVIFDNDYGNFTVKLDPKIILRLRQLKNKMPKGTTWNEVFENLLPKGPKPQKNPKPSNPESRAASTKQKREALAETGGLCSVPGCNKPAEEIHHPKPWAIFHKHDELEPICKAHHELEHQGDNVIDKKFRAYKMQTALFWG